MVPAKLVSVHAHLSNVVESRRNCAFWAQIFSQLAAPASGQPGQGSFVADFEIVSFVEAFSEGRSVRAHVHMLS